MISKYPRPFPWGMRDDIWLSNIRLVRETIKKFRLTPVRDEFLIPEMVVGPKTIKTASLLPNYTGDDVPPWVWKYGGRRAAHVHLGNKVYVLDAKQWSFFSEKVIQGFTAQLKNVKTVGVDRLIELGEVMQGIAPGGR